MKIHVTTSFTLDDYAVSCESHVLEDSYGVRGSPVWYTLDDIKLTEVFFGDEEMDIDALSDEVYEMLIDKAANIPPREWEE
jgi:hypothetical protein